MTRTTVRSYSAVAVLALSSLLSFAGEKPAANQTASTPPKTEQVCQAYPEYSCVEVPTVYGYQSAKQAKELKASARRNKRVQKNTSASSSTVTSASQPQNGN